jgi:hypothetical protein
MMEEPEITHESVDSGGQWRATVDFAIVFHGKFEAQVVKTTIQLPALESQHSWWIYCLSPKLSNFFGLTLGHFKN